MSGSQTPSQDTTASCTGQVAPLSGVAETRGSYSYQHYDPRSATSLPHRAHPFAGARPLHPHRPPSKSEDSSLHPRLDQQRLCPGGLHSHSPILLKNVYSSKEESTSSPSHRSLHPQQNANNTQVQNGVCGSYHQIHHIPHVGDYHGPGRRLLQGSSGGIIPDLPGLHPFRSVPRFPQNFRLPSNAFRPLLSALDLLESHETDKNPPPSKGHDGLLLPRRLLESGRISSSSKISNKLLNPPSQFPRFRNKPQEVCTRSKSILRVFRCNLESSRSQVVPSRSQGSEGSQPSPVHPELGCPVQEGFGGDNRVSQFHSTLSSSRQVVSSSHNSMDEFSYLSSQQRFSCVSGQLTKKNPRSLVEPESTLIPSSDAYPKPFRRVDDRCLPLWLERGPSASSGGGRMAPISLVSLHELEGAPSHSAHSSVLSPTPGSQGLVRQHDSSSLYSPSGIGSLSWIWPPPF